MVALCLKIYFLLTAMDCIIWIMLPQMLKIWHLFWEVKQNLKSKYHARIWCHWICLTARIERLRLIDLSSPLTSTTDLNVFPQNVVKLRNFLMNFMTPRSLHCAISSFWYGFSLGFYYLEMFIWYFRMIYILYYYEILMKSLRIELFLELRLILKRNWLISLCVWLISLCVITQEAYT